MDYNLLLYCNSQNLTKCYAWFLRTKHHGFDFEFNAINFKTTYWFGKVSELPVSLFLLSASVCDKYLICIHQNIEEKKFRNQPLDYCRNDNIIKPQYRTKHLLLIKIDILINFLSSHIALTDALLRLDLKCSSWNEKKRFLFLLLLTFVKHVLKKRFLIM